MSSRGRKPTEGVAYFRHYTKGKPPGLQSLMDEMPIKGYYIYYRLKELCAGSKGLYYGPLYPQDMRELCVVLGVSKLDLWTALVSMANSGLIDAELLGNASSEWRVIWFNGLDEECARIYQKRGRLKPLKPSRSSLSELLGISGTEITIDSISAPKKATAPQIKLRQLPYSQSVTISGTPIPIIEYYYRVYGKYSNRVNSEFPAQKFLTTEMLALYQMHKPLMEGAHYSQFVWFLSDDMVKRVVSFEWFCKSYPVKRTTSQLEVAWMKLAVIDIREICAILPFYRWCTEKGARARPRNYLKNGYFRNYPEPFDRGNEQVESNVMVVTKNPLANR